MRISCPRFVPLLFLLAPLLLVPCSTATADETRIDVHPDRLISVPCNLLTGVCLEDVNHEVYGGIYSQLIFGESFQESPANTAQAVGKISGMWRPILHGTPSPVSASTLNRPLSEPSRSR